MAKRKQPKRKRSWLRRILGFGVVAGVAYTVWREIEANRADQGDTAWESQPFPFPPQPRASQRHWLDPVDGGCPTSHPVKAKLTSGIYHVPGGLNYERTSPDRCYLDAATAEADGLRGAKN